VPPPLETIKTFVAEDKLEPLQIFFLPAPILLCMFPTETLDPAIFRAVAAGRPRALGMAEEVFLVAYFISREGIKLG
jgi:hypothetical protein